MKMVRDACGAVEVVAEETLSRRDMKRIARFVEAVGGEGRFQILRPSRALSKQWGIELVPGYDVDFGIGIDGYGCEWSGSGDYWFAATLLRAVQAAGFVTALWGYRSEGYYRAEALHDEGEDVEALAWCGAKTETLAVAGLALWAYRTTRRKARCS